MKTRLMTLAAIVAMICSTGCEKAIDNTVDTPAINTGKTPVSLTASITNPGTKVTYADTPAGLKASWEATEKITVVSLDRDYKAIAFDTFTSTGEAGRTTAKFTGTLSDVEGVIGYDCWYPALEPYSEGSSKYRTPYKNDKYSSVLTAELNSIYIQYDNTYCAATGDNSTTHLPSRTLMTGLLAGNADEGFTTELKHETCVVKTILNFPESAVGTYITGISIEGSSNFATARTWGYISSRLPSDGRCVHPGGGPQAYIRCDIDDIGKDGHFGDLLTSKKYTANIPAVLTSMPKDGTWTVTVRCLSADSKDYDTYTAVLTFPEDKVFANGKLYTVNVNLAKEGDDSGNITVTDPWVGSDETKW